MQITTRGMNNSMTNMVNVHTFTASGANLIASIVLLMEAQLVEAAGDVVGGVSCDTLGV